MIRRLDEIIEKYSNYQNIDIERIIRFYGIQIDYLDFKDINGIIIGNRIGINKNISIEKQRFTLAHELCHFLLDEKGVSKGPFASEEFSEKRADEFASKLLLPEKYFIELWQKHKNIFVLKEIFNVPIDVVRNRLVGILFGKQL